MNAEIIAIGSELLLGETVDTNSAYLARQLAGVGVNVFRKMVVGDNEGRIAAAINEALGRADLVVCTGGLGPTVDDMSREAVAAALGRPLVFHQHLLDQIAARFRAFGRTMSGSNARQAYVPEGARIVENPRGTAPAFIVEDVRGTVVVLPGVPSEMRFLTEHALLPYLQDERGQTGVILVQTIHAVGLTESQIGELLADLMAQENPTLGISAKRAQYELRIGAKSTSRAGAEALLIQTEAVIRTRLGDHVIGSESLEQMVGQLLGDQALSIALFEGNIRAPVYRALAGVAASLLRGAVMQPIAEAVTEQECRQFAREGALAVRERWQADVALGVQPALVSGQSGFTTVAVALAHEHGVEEFARSYDLRVDEHWDFVATLVFDLLRHYLTARAHRADAASAV